jgi:hypothetical protein
MGKACFQIILIYEQILLSSFSCHTAYVYGSCVISYCYRDLLHRILNHSRDSESSRINECDGIKQLFPQNTLMLRKKQF